MKKIIFIFLAMISMALTITSCSKEEDEERPSITISTTVYDPRHELTDKQEKEVNFFLYTQVGSLKIYKCPDDTLSKISINWLTQSLGKIYTYISTEHSELFSTDAGIEFLYNGERYFDSPKPKFRDIKVMLEE